MSSNNNERDYIAWWLEHNAKRGDRVIEFGGIPFYVPSNVFSPDPELTNSSAQVYRALGNVSGLNVLDMGTGAGVLGIHCALRGANVVATDTSIEALLVAKQNAERHNVSSCLQFIESDLFQNIRGRFDLILANLPIVDQAWGGLKKSVTEQMATYFRDLPDFLAPNGIALISFASFGDEKGFRQLLGTQRLNISEEIESRFGVHWYLFRIKTK